MASEADARHPDDSVLSRLWEIAHKYQRRLATGEVVPLRESEADRRAVAPFGRRLETTTERTLDGLTYRSLAEMQVRRDSRRLLSNLPARLRLRRLGLDVALRAKPVVFLHGPLQLVTNGLLASVGFTPDALEPTEDANALRDELDASDHRVRMRSVDDAELEALRGEVKRRLVGLRLKADALAECLTSGEADLLSQLVRKGEVALFTDRDGHIEIREGGASRSAPSTVVALCPSRRGARRG
ncbi:MAG TPA: hypothetical protein VNE39_10345 [Planctomycetota bacterium]|nr:hypothetical protein [Planctomycetota bacterium]